ncbi:MAG: zinc ribbon domain-containing protein [Promethearchaeota archaeon]
MNILKGRNQFIRILYLIICIILLIQFFVPTYVLFDLGDYLELSFYFGVYIVYDLAYFSIIPSYFSFSIEALISSLPLLAALVLLIILLILCNKLERGGVLGIGITSAVLMIVGPLLNELVFASFTYNVVRPEYIYLLALCAVIVALGIIMILKEPETPKVGSSKVSTSEVKEKNPEQPTCPQCGAVIRAGSQFCVDCGTKF